MVIPAILSYPLPGSPDLPKNKVNWTPDPERAVLLIHDMQQYFIDPFDINTSPMKEVIANIKELRSKCHDLGIPVIYSAQPGGQKREQRALLQDFWGSGMDDGPYQKKIIDQLSPDEDDIVLTKWRREGLDVNFIELAERPTIADWWTLLSSRSQKISSK